MIEAMKKGAAVAFAALVLIGCGRGTQTSQEAASPGPAQASVTDAVTE